MSSGPRMRFNSPLTRVDVVAVQECNPESADVRALLWEVKRFHVLALYVDRLQRSQSSGYADWIGIFPSVFISDSSENGF